MGDVVELGFRSSVRPGLGFEVMRFSQLRRRTLSHPLDGLTRPRFHLVGACLTGRSRHRVDFERCLVRGHDLFCVAPGRVQAFDATPGLELALLDLLRMYPLINLWDVQSTMGFYGVRLVSDLLIVHAVALRLVQFNVKGQPR